MSSVICVANLYPKTDVTDLCKTFGKFGRILSASIDYDRNLASLRRGHIFYGDASSADFAAKEMNGKRGLGNSISVNTEKYKSHYDIPQNDPSKIFVKMDHSWDEAELMKEFGKFGEIDDAKVYDTDGKSNGYGFVKFLEPSAAKAAIEEKNGEIINGKELVVEPFVHWTLREKEKRSLDVVKVRSVERNNLHVKNLHRDVTEDELRRLFEPFGNIGSVKISTDDTGLSRGFGFVCFSKEEDAAEARERMDHYMYKSKALEVNYNQKKSARLQYLRALKTDSGVRRFQHGKESVRRE